MKFNIFKLSFVIIVSMKKRIVSFAHGIIVILAYSSPFWLDWRIFFVLFVLYFLQIIIFKGCVLSYLEYGTFRQSFSTNFVATILGFLGLKVEKRSIKYFLDRVLPALLIFLAVIWQIIFHFQPLVSW